MKKIIFLISMTAMSFTCFSQQKNQIKINVPEIKLIKDTKNLSKNDFSKLNKQRRDKIFSKRDSVRSQLGKRDAAINILNKQIIKIRNYQDSISLTQIKQQRARLDEYEKSIKQRNK